MKKEKHWMEKGLLNPVEYKKVWEKVKSGEFKYSVLTIESLQNIFK